MTHTEPKRFTVVFIVTGKVTIAMWEMLYLHPLCILCRLSISYTCMGNTGMHRS